MSSSLIPAFTQVRLSGQFLSVGGDNRLKLGADLVLYERDSGNFANNASLSSTGSNLYIDLTGLSGQFNANFATIVNVGTTGSNLYNDIIGLSGLLPQYITTGSELNFTTGIPTGVDVFYVNYLNYTFAGIPKVQITFELTQPNNIGYYFAVSGRSITGFFAISSDTILETGNFLDVFAKL